MQITDIVKLYFDEEKSVIEIAEMYSTYPAKISRFLTKNGYKLRDRSEAQKIVLKNGKSEHPTKGKPRSDAEKEAISQANHEKWKNLSDKERKYRSKIGKNVWKSMTKQQKADFQEKSKQAVRRASIEGSQLERYLYQRLMEEGYNVTMHKTGLVANINLEVDLYISDLSAIIEVDGPAHFENIWGEEHLARNIKSDNEKTGLFLSKGFTVLRIKDLRKNKSKIYFKTVAEKVLELLEQVKLGTTNKFLEVQVD